MRRKVQLTQMVREADCQRERQKRDTEDGEGGAETSGGWWRKEGGKQMGKGKRTNKGMRRETMNKEKEGEMGEGEMERRREKRLTWEEEEMGRGRQMERTTKMET